MRSEPLTFAVLAALAGAVGTRSIGLPRLGLRVVAADAFIFCALLSLAPAAAPLVALASMLGVALGKGGKLLSVKTALNMGVVPLSMAAGTVVFLLLGGSHRGHANMVIPLLAAAVTFALMNVPLTAAAVSLSTGSSWIGLCRQSIGVAIISNATNAFVGAGLMLVLSAVGPLGLALGLIPLIPMESYTRYLAGRLERERSDGKPAERSISQVAGTM